MAETSSPARYVLEAAVLAVAVTVINLFVPGDPGFLSSSVNPFILVALLMAAYRGWLYGYVFLTVATGLAAALFGLMLAAFFPLTYQIPDLAVIWDQGRAPLLAAIVGIYIFGQISRILRRRQRFAEEATEELRNAASRRQQQVTALTAVNNELQWRVSKLDDSVALLVDYLDNMGHQRLAIALDSFLQATVYFTSATRCSIWEHDRQDDQLVLRASHGWDQDEAELEGTIPVSGTLEGWVVRNNREFDIRLLQLHDNLRGLDHDEAVYIYPVVVDARVWGVVRVEELPFQKFSAYTERLLRIIVHLAGRGLAGVLRFGGRVDPTDVHDQTGYPRFEQFRPLLEREIEERSPQGDSLSLILLEIANYNSLVQRYGRGAATKTLHQCIDACAALSGNGARAFHYRDESQLAFVYPNLDFDGAAMFAVAMIEWVSTNPWEGLSKELLPEVALGYSSLSSNTADVDSLLETAENLLLGQRSS